ncbi:Sugar phosphate permease (UhpC) [Fructobacillus fructosus]|uniref:MFS transporter n=1 Tax=Fructobacillus fructosus TaxID=1631 RepID=UPI002DAE4D85|nr:Sugar phosphate permease (UhpC) [Fructobacillus fructosus]
MKASQNIRLTTGLYANYFVHGFGMIILTQNLLQLAHNWSSTLTTASFILSGIGIGRLVAYLLMGFISDHFGRKTSLLIGISTYLIFLVLTPINHSLSMAYALTVLMGIANSALDSATYPLLEEVSKKGTANTVLLKAFISTGEFLLPMIVLFLANEHLWFGLSFMVPAAVLLVNLINIITLPVKEIRDKTIQATKPALQVSSGKKVILLIALLVYGFSSMAVMIWFTQWITIFAEGIGFSKSVAHFLLSLYSLGSITGVLIVASTLSRFNVKKLLFLGLNILSLVAIVTLALTKNVLLANLAAFFFGLSAAGGLMQIALNSLLTIFPNRKGLMTGTFFIFGSIASFTVPIITGVLIKVPGLNIILADASMAILSLLVAITVYICLPNESRSLADARKTIDKIDKEILQLIDQRFTAVSDVIFYKEKSTLAIQDLKREGIVLDKIAKESPRKELVPYNQAIIQAIMDQSKKYQAAKSNQLNK